MLTVLLLIAFAVFAMMVVRANQNKRDEVRLPIYIENLRALRRRRQD